MRLISMVSTRSKYNIVLPINTYYYMSLNLEELLERLQNFSDYEGSLSASKVKILIDGEVVVAKSLIIDDNNEFFINCDE